MEEKAVAVAFVRPHLVGDPTFSALGGCSSPAVQFFIDLLGMKTYIFQVNGIRMNA